MSYPQDPNAVPLASYGAVPLPEPQPQGQEPAPVPEPAPQDLPVEEPQPILGKFKSTEDLASSYQQLEQAHGRQSTEIGDLRKQTELLQKALEATQKASSVKEVEATGAPTDWESQIREIQNKVDQGEMSPGEGVVLAARLTREQAKAEAQQEFQQFDRQKTIQQAQSTFLDQNPDFEQARGSGALRQIMKQNPLHDEFSAYFLWKGQQDLAAAQAGKEAAVSEAYNKGRSEIAKLADGAQVADKTLSKPGASMRPGTQPTKLKNEKDLRASMMNALGGET